MHIRTNDKQDLWCNIVPPGHNKQSTRIYFGFIYNTPSSPLCMALLAEVLQVSCGTYLLYQLPRSSRDIYIYIYICIYTCLLLISMLSHRQAIFRIKRRQVVFLCWMQDLNPEGLWISSRLNAHWQTDWAIEDQAKNLNATAHRRAFRPLDHTYIYMYMYMHTHTHTCPHHTHTHTHTPHTHSRDA